MTNALTAERPPRRSPLNIAGRVLGGLVATGLGLVQGMFWLLVAGFRCDESCDDAPISWHGNADAWQWSALGWLGAGCFALLRRVRGLALHAATARLCRPAPRRGADRDRALDPAGDRLSA
jgi:hypothetical protein